MAPAIQWGFSDQNITWRLQRGRMGFRPPGEMVVKGEGSTPVILTPAETTIDWSLYRAILICMIAEGGSEIRIKIGPLERKKELGPSMQWRVYRFDLDITIPTIGLPLVIMPTDHLSAPAAIDFVELVPRQAAFTRPVGLQFVGKREEYRAVMYAHAPSQVTYEVLVPPGGMLAFGLGVAEKHQPVAFRVLAGPASQELYSASLDDPEVWWDTDVDLSRFAGQTLKLVFETASDKAGAIGLRANPLMTSRQLPKRPNVVLYVICSLRADHTSLQGYARETTPFLKQLGASSIVFEDAHAQAPWTKASVPSLLTSLHAYTMSITNETSTIPSGARTLAQRLRDAGYVTASVVTNPFAGRATGLQVGLDYLMEYPVVHRVKKDAVDRGTDSAALNRVLFPWIERHRDEPFFLYAHSTDPHAPFRPPAGFEEKWANPAETEAFNRNYSSLHDLRQYGGGQFSHRALSRPAGSTRTVSYSRPSTATTARSPLTTAASLPCSGSSRRPACSIIPC